MSDTTQSPYPPQISPYNPEYDPAPPFIPEPNEKAHQFEALLDYWRLGPGRSLTKLVQLYVERELSGESVPSSRDRTIREWSRQFDWQNRVLHAQYKLELELQELWKERQLEIRERDFKQAEKLRNLVDDALEQGRSFIKADHRILKGQDGQPDREIITMALDIRALLQALKISSDLQRKAAGMTDITAAVLDIDLTQLTDQQIEQLSAGIIPKDLRLTSGK